MFDDVIAIISFIASILSIFIGIGAIVQAKRYNELSEKINNDTKIMLNTQIRSLEVVQKEIVREQLPASSVINMSKDQFFIYKLSNFEKKNIDLILGLFYNLYIKGKTYQYIKVFLEDNRKICFNLDFYYEAKTKDGKDIKQIENELFKYGILIKIDYMAQPIKN
ncbi:MAG TPA: hypothetical protein H9955_02070 [Candidatus Mediterraneibacter cottocaccae]|nr:hypothetical protein [Candidatus Mediterraneibacter cottocaccae]